MANETGEITVNPQVMLLENVLRDIAAGHLRVPMFQRPFIWRPEQMLDLFDSIERGYPIGSLLVWDTENQISSQKNVAGIEIPPPPAGQRGILLDGHQRISTLFGSLLHRPDRETGETDASRQSQQKWMWDIYRELGGEAKGGEGQFRHWRRPGPPPAKYLPMRAVLRTMDFLAYSRKLSESVKDEAKLTELVSEAERLAQRIKSYQVAVIRVKGGSLQQVVEIFSRLNTSGQPMTPPQMVSALTYGGEGEGETLADRIDAIAEDLGGAGYGDITATTIFRSILAVAGEQDVQRTQWDSLAKRVQGKLDAAVADTEGAIRLTVGFLQDHCRVPLARLVPYQLQVMLLTAAFHENPDPSPEQRRFLEQWFWGTSWSGYFASANTTQVRNDLDRMKRFARGEVPLPWDPQAARPFPNRFDFRSARVRAYLLWELRRFEIRLDLDGKPVDPVSLLARSHTTAYQQVCTGTRSSSHPANRLTFPTPSGVSPRRALLDLWNDAPVDLTDEILASQGIPHAALGRLAQGDAEGFINQRADYLAQMEAEFISSMGIEPASESSGEADIDTE